MMPKFYVTVNLIDKDSGEKSQYRKILLAQSYTEAAKDALLELPKTLTDKKQVDNRMIVSERGFDEVHKQDKVFDTVKVMKKAGFFDNE